MIVLPKRSVTRFFIPLIDVLTLMFCIFLLMPVLQKADSSSDADKGAMAVQLRQMQDELARIRAQGGDTRALQEQLEKLRQQVGKSIKDRVAVRVLEVDAKTGKLYYNDPERIEIRNQADASTLIERDRRERGVGQRELYYLILYPRDRNSSYPTVAQYEQYQRWFEGVALGFDIPGEIAHGGSRP
jgi:hypothetical protein